MKSSLFLSPGRMSASVAILAMSSLTAAAHAATITNGNFTMTNATTSSEFGTRYPSVSVTGYTTSGYNFVFLGSQHTANSEFGTGNVTLPSAVTPAPGGGNFLALDAEAGYAGAVSTTVTGLNVGQMTYISFYYAGTEQVGFTGPTTQQLAVTLGGETHLAPSITLPTAGFSGWSLQTIAFTATAATETLSFLTSGGPSGAPPFTLISNVSVGTTPEPSSLALLSTGLFGVAGFVRSRFKNKQ